MGSSSPSACAVATVVVLSVIVVAAWPVGSAAAADSGGRLAPVEVRLLDIQRELEGLVMGRGAEAAGAEARLDELEADLDRLERRLHRSSERDALAERLASVRGTVARVRAGASVPDKRQAGSISGTVTDESMNPFQRSVSLYGPGDYYIDGTSSDYNTGEYQFGGLEDGTYFVRAGYAGGDEVVELYNDIPCPNQYCWADDGTPVIVFGGAAVTGIDFQLAEAGSIKGSVFKPGSDWGMDDVRVQIYDPAHASFGGEVGDDWTDYDGDAYTYEVRGLPAGCYFASAVSRRNWDENYAPTAYPDVPLVWEYDAPLVGDPIAVEVGSVTDGTDITLVGGSVIAAQVTEEAGAAPVVNSYLTVWGKTLSGGWEGVWQGGDDKRDSSGIFLAEGLGAGEYAVIAGAYPGEGPRKSAPQTREQADLVGEIWEDIPCPAGACGPDDGTVIQVGASSLTTLEIALAAGGRISGTVTDEGTKALLDGIEVQATAPGLSGWTGWADAWEGVYTIYGLPAGSYSVRAVGRRFDQGGPWKDPGDPGYVTELYDGVSCAGFYCDTALATPVAVTVGAETSGIDFALAIEGIITGSVWPAGKSLPFRGVTVAAWAPGGQSTGVEDVTDFNGDFVLPGLSTAGYFVTADTRGLGLEEVGELYDNVPCPAGNCDPTTGDAVVVTAGSETADVDLYLDVGGVIEGIVTDGSGPGELVVPGVLVTVVDGSGAVFGAALTACDGTYSIGGLVSGTYYAYTMNYRGHEDQLFDKEPCGGPCVPAAGDPIAVVAGSTTSGVDFSLNVLFADGFESGDSSAW